MSCLLCLHKKNSTRSLWNEPNLFIPYFLFLAEERLDVSAFANKYLSENHRADKRYCAAHEDIAEEVCTDDNAADCHCARVEYRDKPQRCLFRFALDIKHIDEHDERIEHAGRTGVTAREGFAGIRCAEEGTHLLLIHLTVDDIPAGEIVKPTY